MEPGEAAAPAKQVHRSAPIVFQVDGSSGSMTVPEQASPRLSWHMWLVLIYFAGLFTALARLGLGLFVSSHLVEKSLVIRGTKANELLEEIAAEHQLPYPYPHLGESQEITSPVVVGGQGSVILLPPQWSEWEQWKLRAVLAHEVTHTLRGDCFVVLIAALNRALFWFHPLAWWLEKRLAHLCELASDDAAVTMTGDPVRYAQVLLEMVAETGGRRVRLMTRALAAPSMAAGNTTRRIQRLLDVKNWSGGVLPLRSWFVIGFIALPLLAILAAAQAPSSTMTAGDVAPSWQWQAEGFKTTAEEARALEQGLLKDPENIAIRARLIAYYLYNAMPNELHPHAVWVIEHHPESELAGSEPVISGYAGVFGTQGAQKQGEVRSQLWLGQATLHNDDARVQGNAGTALMRTDQSEAERLLLRARELDPQNGRWEAQLVRLYAEAIRSGFFANEGLSQFWPYGRVDSAFLARTKDQLDRSQDAALVGKVGAVLAEMVVHTREFRQAQQNEIDAARTNIAGYARVLLERAIQARDLPEWRHALRQLDDLSKVAVTPRQSESTTSSSVARRISVPPAEQAERLIRSTPAIYPPLARQARIQGVVRLRILVGIDGRVQKVDLMNGHPILAPSAMEAVRMFVYSPALADGQPAEVDTVVDVHFTLPE